MLYLIKDSNWKKIAVADKYKNANKKLKIEWMILFKS